jgi:hypothetical protein
MSELRPEEGSEEISEEKPDSDGFETEEAETSDLEPDGEEETSEKEPDSDGSETEEPVRFKPKPLSDY